MPESARIHILSDAVARKIAAGEVIERPQSVVRELLDNSLDAGAASIDLRLDAGGNDLIRVTDDGSGMAKEDLERCYLPHATSKITTEDDLLHLQTLGFRGEALSSIAAISRLTVTSAASSVPHRIEIHGGKLIGSAPSAGSRGTTVEVAGLFFNTPARKQFLKRAQAESGLARSVLIDKALAFPEVTFRLFAGEDLRLFLPAAGRTERIAAAYPERTAPALLHSLAGSGEGFTFEVVAGEPGVSRRDRKQVQVFVNRRRIWEYALVQAVEYAYRDYLHGGLFPVAYLFLQVEPELVDFNIHPAKREARFRNLPEIHRRVVDSLASYLRPFDRTYAREVFGTGAATLPGIEQGEAITGVVADAPWKRYGAGRATGRPPSGPAGHSDARWSALNRATQRTGSSGFDLSRSFELPEESAAGFRYLGQLFGLFLVVERDDRLLLLDQHAAHERIIYDRLMEGPASQELLFPVAFTTEVYEADVMEAHAGELEKLGVGLRRTGSESWELVGVPASVDIDAEAVIDMIRELTARPQEFGRELYASMSCRAAVMDGDVISRQTALSIITSSLDLPNARCPHGRPIWAEFSREQLMKIVGRI